ncbi:AraC family transcriptional regulator [Staphylococcus simulans]|uniref:helix-turn-helix domain-containing protein n=1 Tax=Staphylococcus simulans TaxID=1286 RepID=UPI000D03EC95|nr:AraC family transcriptional regulator [Staphylococcus simulans]MCD8916454.1 AraC family transcriptional regulator [Staphylococcus simulans]
MDYNYYVFTAPICIKDCARYDEYFNIYFVLSGKVIVNKLKHVFHYRAGDIFIQAPNFTSPEIEVKKGKVACLSIHKVYFGQVYLKDVPKVESNFEVYNFIKRDYIDALRLVYDNKMVKANTVILRLIKYLRVYVENFDNCLYGITKHSTINKVIRYVNNNFHEPLKLSSMSARFHVNHSYLSRKFKQELHMTYQEYVNKVKLYNAAEYLALNTDAISMMETMWEKYAFASQRAYLGHFINQFKLAPEEFYIKAREKRLKDQELTNKVYREIMKFID